MTIDWKLAFTQIGQTWKDGRLQGDVFSLPSLHELKQFLDLVHIKYCLLKPYSEFPDYPLVETRELLPSFETDLWEHSNLPGFSMVAFARPIQYFSEVFQFDLLHPLADSMRGEYAQAMMTRNIGAITARLPRLMQEQLRQQFQKTDVTSLAVYPALLPFLLQMDRAQVFGLHGPHPQDLQFYLAGVYASLPSDFDTEVKRFGMRIGKFDYDDSDSYERNRLFVCQFLMELYGFPMASERRTSASLFARRLHKMGEKFLIRTLGQSDRTLTTLWNPGGTLAYPLVEKIALVRVDEDHEQFEQFYDEGFLVDAKRRIVILRVQYRQHAFCQDNVRQERALSVAAQELIHPLTGKALGGVSIIRDTSTMPLRLNDIVRGEFMGRVVYKRNEIVENTDTVEKRLKVLYAWLSKHQRRIISYSDEFYAQIDKILDGYLFSPEQHAVFAEKNDLYQEVLGRYNYIQQARKVRLLEELQERVFKGSRISYAQMLSEAVAILHALKFEIVNYFDSLVGAAISTGESILNNRYLVKKYIEKSEDSLSQTGLEIKKNYGKLVALLDELKAIRKSREKNSRHLPGPLSA